jgi:hypothetical protein
MSMKDDTNDLRSIANEIEEFNDGDVEAATTRMIEDWAISLREIADSQDEFMRRLESALGIRVKQ